MNAVQAAETSGDQELICTAYTTAVLHMREVLVVYFLVVYMKFLSYILQVDLMFIFTVWIAPIDYIVSTFVVIY